MIMGGKHGRARMGPVVEALDNSERGGDINGGQEEEEVEEDGIVETRLGGRGRLVSCGEVQHRNCTLAAAPLHGLVKTRDRRRLVARQAQGFGLAVRHPSSTGSTAGEPKGNLFAGIVDTPTQSASSAPFRVIGVGPCWRWMRQKAKWGPARGRFWVPEGLKD